MPPLIRLVLTVAVIVTTSSVLLAQKRPDFSGTWIAISPTEAAGEEQVVKQDATTMTVSHGAEGDDHVSVYRLDGSESRNVMKSHGAEIVTLARATWKGEQLTITSATTYPDGRKLQQEFVWSLDGKGQLVVEFSETMSGKEPHKMTLVARKKGALR